MNYFMRLLNLVANIVTDLGVGVGMDAGCGEWGWVVEEEVMNGRLVVEWNDKVSSGDMNLIDSVVLKNGGEWKIGEIITPAMMHDTDLSKDTATAKSILDSLKATVLTRPAPDKLTRHVRSGNAFRAQLNESVKAPKSTRAD